ncbi:MAG: DMT family transporter, partial [Bacillota bacterium]
MTDANGEARVLGDGVLVLITMIWGFTFVAVKDAVAKVPVFTFLAMRFGLAVLVLAGIMAWERARDSQEAGGSSPGGADPVQRTPWWGSAWPGLLTGLFLFAGYALQTVGLQYTTPGKAGFITGLSVVLVPVLDALAFRRPQQPAALAGVGLAAGGMALMFLEPTDLAVRRGDVLVLLCAIAFAAHVTAVARGSRRGRPARFS